MLCRLGKLHHFRRINMANHFVSHGNADNFTNDTSSLSLNHAHHNSRDYSNGKTANREYIHETASSYGRGKKFYRFRDWWREISAWIVGAAFVAGIVYILYHYNGTPVSEWPIPIQISTSVSFLAQVASAALL